MTAAIAGVTPYFCRIYWHGILKAYIARMPRIFAEKIERISAMKLRCRRRYWRICSSAYIPAVPARNPIVPPSADTTLITASESVRLSVRTAPVTDKTTNERGTNTNKCRKLEAKKIRVCYFSILYCTLFVRVRLLRLHDVFI